MLLQSLRAHCFAQGGSGSIWNYLGAPVRSTGVSGRFACGFRTDLHFAEEGEHQVKTANNNLVNAEASGTISFYVDRPSAKPANIVLQHVLYVPSVSNGSNPLARFRVRVGTGTEPLQRFLPHENPDLSNWAGFTTKNLAFYVHNFGSN
jgi:hypothetical protein